MYDEAHSPHEERWLTVAQSLDATLLVVAHTFQPTGPASARVRLISARAATKRERRSYEEEPR